MYECSSNNGSPVGIQIVGATSQIPQQLRSASPEARASGQVYPYCGYWSPMIVPDFSR